MEETWRDRARQRPGLTQHKWTAMKRMIENDTKIVVDYQTDIEDYLRKAEEAPTLGLAMLANQEAENIMKRCIRISTRILIKARDKDIEVNPLILVYGELD